MGTNDFDYILNLFQEEQKSMVSENKQVFEHLFLNDSNRSNLKECVDLLRVAFRDLEARKGFLEMCSLLKALAQEGIAVTQIYTILKQTNIKDFVKFVKEFRRLPNKYLVELSGKTGNKKSTPMIGIAGVINTFENKNSIIVRFRDNTCKMGATYNEQWRNLFLMNTLCGALRHAERDLHQAQWSETTNNLFGIKADEIQNKIKEDYKGHQTIRVNKLARTLTQKANVLNVCFRGKGSGDHTDTDSDEYNIFSMLNKGLPDNEGLKLYQKYKLKFLFDRVSYNNYDNDNDEPIGMFKEHDNSKLNALGRRITERVLKLFLPNNEYEVKNTNGEIKVVAKNNKYSVAKYYLEYFGKQEFGEQKQGKIQYKEWTDFKNIMSKFCTNNFPAPEGLPDTEQEFRNKLDKINCEDVLKSMEGMKIPIDRNDFVDMLVGILYVHDENVHGYAHGQNGKMAEDVKASILKNLRTTFALPDEACDDEEIDPAPVISNYAPNYFKTKINKSIPGLPSAFPGYSSSDSEKKYSPLNYIQALFAAPLIVKKYYEADIKTRSIVAANINKLRDIFVADSDADYNLVYNEIQTQIKKNSSMKPQELFAMMICDGTIYTTKNAANKNERDDITNICDVAHDLTEYDLDDKTRKQVTQLNFVELPKDKEGKEGGWYINESDGTLMLPLNVDRLYNPEKFKFESFDNTDNLNNGNQNLNNNVFAPQGNNLNQFNYWQNYNVYNNQNLNNNVFAPQGNNLNQFNCAQNYNNQNKQDNINNNFEVNNNDLNSNIQDSVIHSQFKNNNNNHIDKNRFNLFANDDNKNNSQEQENKQIEECVKQWVTSAGVQNDDNLKKILEEYAHKEKVDDVDKTSEYDFVVDLIRIYRDDLRGLRKALGLKDQEENKNPNEEEKKELNNIKNQNLNEEQLPENSNNSNNKFQNNNNSLDQKQNENIDDKNNNKKENYSCDLKDDNSVYLNNNSANQKQNNNNFIDGLQNEQNKSNNDIDNPSLNNNNVFIDQYMQNENSDQAQNPSFGGQNLNNQNEQNNMNNSSKINKNFTSQMVNNINLTNNNHNEINNDINKKNDINSLALYKKIKGGDHFCRDVCMLEASKYKAVKEYFTFLEKVKVLLYWIFTLAWILKRSVDYTTHVNLEKKKSVTYQNKPYEKEKNSQNKESSYQRTIRQTSNLDMEK